MVSVQKNKIRIAQLILIILISVMPLHVGAQSLEETTCYIFDGKTDCKKVKVLDWDNCVVKIYPHVMPFHEPESLGCLIDSLQTKIISFKKLKPIAIKSLKPPSKSSTQQQHILTLRGAGAISILTAYNDHGGPVWSDLNHLNISVQGDLKRTQFMVQNIQTNLCSIQSKIVVADRTQVLSQSKGEHKISMSVKEAYTKLKNGDIVLIDIRRPTEWKQTGIAENALPISMHQATQNFVQQLRTIQLQNPNKRMAFICATGGRSAYLQRTLPKYGIENIIDVSEGMFGSSAGKGWIKSGLPVKTVN